MSNDEIRELIRLAEETGVAELEVQRGENRVRIRKSFGGEGNIVFAAPQAAPVAAAPVAPAPKAEGAAAKQPDSLHYVPSPIVGTYYESSSPDSPPFIKVGDHVRIGQVLCIIESMKLMNEIEADVAGVVESRLVPNGQPVEYGEKLFGIRPL
jgi:acetyl-CoA carboxylase biotin carboxyl carrier protein